MATYTGVADANGDFTVSFGSNSYTGGQKVVVTAQKDSATKSIEIHAPSGVTGGGVIQFTGTMNNFPMNIGGVILSSEIGASIAANTFYASESGGYLFRIATSLVLHQGLTTVGDSSFLGWASARSISIPSTLATISAYAFYGWTSATSLVIPNNVTSIGANSFNGWTSATSLTLSNSLTSIPASAFSTWTLATSLVIPGGVVTILANAFLSWSAAKSLLIPATVNNIAANAFATWRSAEVITVLATTPPVIQSNTFANLNAAAIFKVPAASVAAYQAAANWSAFASRIQAI